VKTQVEVDDAKLAAIRALLGTQTPKATIDAALDEVIALDARRRALLAQRTEGGYIPEVAGSILAPVTKRLVEIDDELLERARAASGASTIRGAVEAGLQRLVQDQVVNDHIAWLRSGTGLDLDALSEARNPRLLAFDDG
jgi:Arc/MetJ family transcription regulator